MDIITTSSQFRYSVPGINETNTPELGRIWEAQLISNYCIRKLYTRANSEPGPALIVRPVYSSTTYDRTRWSLALSNYYLFDPDCVHSTRSAEFTNRWNIRYSVGELMCVPVVRISVLCFPFDRSAILHVKKTLCGSIDISVSIFRYPSAPWGDISWGLCFTAYSKWCVGSCSPNDLRSCEGSKRFPTLLFSPCSTRMM